MPPLAEVAEPQPPERDPPQFYDAVADGLAHPPHLPLPALSDRDLEQSRLHLADPGGRSLPVIELDPLAKPPKGALADWRRLDAVPLLCAREIDVPGALPRVIRLLVHCYGDDAAPPQHVYLRDAVSLRRDLQGAQ